LGEPKPQSWTATPVWGLKGQSFTATAVGATAPAVFDCHCGSGPLPQFGQSTAVWANSRGRLQLMSTAGAETPTAWTSTAS